MPSRHIPLTRPDLLHTALERLHRANMLGWGAFYGLATRQYGLTRWQRGGQKAICEVPAIIADIDEPPEIALPRVRAFPLPPSCIVCSGHGLHLYWLLDRPTSDVQAVNAIQRSLSHTLKGDYLTAATALRLPGSRNTKHDPATPCEVLESDCSRRYTLANFDSFRHFQHDLSYRFGATNSYAHDQYTRLTPDQIQQTADTLLAQGFRRRGDWLNGPCPHSENHKHGDRHPSFGFNTRTGHGYCFVCGFIPPVLL